MPDGKKSATSYSLRGQLIALVAALVIPLFALQVSWSYRDYQGARARAEADALAFADATALGVRQFFAQAEELLTATANQLGVDWDTTISCDEDMRTLTDLLPFLANAVVIDADGAVRCSALPAPAGSSALEWPWFPSIVEDSRFLVSEPVFGDFTGTWILPIVVPMLDPDGSFVGAVTGTVSLRELSRLFGGLVLPGDHLITVATADRIVIARSHDAESRVGGPLPPTSGSETMVGPGRWVATGPDFAGLDRTWGQVEIPELGWIVYVGVPDDIVYGPALRDVVEHAGATLLVVLLGMLFAARSYGRIAAALSELADKTRTTAAGEIVPLPPGTPSEVTAVVEQFNHTLMARDRARAAERHARDRFESIFDNAVFGLYVSTREGQFLQVNPALASMLRYESTDALMEVSPSKLYVAPPPTTDVPRESIDDGRVETQELEWLRADGVPITVRVGGKMIAGPGGEDVFEMIVQDITEERRTEDELRQAQKMEAIGNLAGGIAHDFNNLLTVIGGNVELLEEELDSEDPLRDDLGHIAMATRRAASLTDRLLTFSRKGVRDEQVMDINHVIVGLSQMLGRLIGENLTFDTQLAHESLPISIDAGELQQVVLNLVLNARDATPDGGHIVIRTKRSASEPDTQAGIDDLEAGQPIVILTVSDSGAGMNAATQQRMFEPFFTTKAVGTGTGLGLSTVYGIVRRAGGHIAVDSEPGRGTTVALQFPLVDAPRGGDSEDYASAVTPEAVRGTEHILVVEDEELVRDFVSRALAEVGFQVLVAGDGHEALDVLESAETSVDLVVTDVVMPRMTGPELAGRLEGIAPTTPVLFMSGHIDNPLFSAELERRAERFLRKPFSAAELRSKVRRALDVRAALPVGD